MRTTTKVMRAVLVALPIVVAAVACVPAASLTQVAMPSAERQRELVSIVNAGPWTFSSRPDQITDVDRRLLYTDATSYPSILERDAHLGVRCDVGRDGAKLDIYVNADTYLSNRSVRADYRLDDRPAVQSGSWVPSTTGVAAFVPVSQFNSLFQGMLSGSTLLVRLYDFRGTPYTYTFDIEGFGTAVELLGCRTAQQ